jgi:hypothetical protein
MRFGTLMSVTVCVFASGLGVVGCSPSNSSSSAGASAATGSDPTTQAAAGTSTPASSHEAQAQATASTGRCQAANLSFSLADNHQVAQGQQLQVVDMTNRASSACTMEGFPVVDLIGDTSSQKSYDWTLVHSSANGSAMVNLQPGATAHFDLAYVPGDLASGGGSKNVITVQKMVIKTPGDDNQGDSDVQGSLQWFQDVVLQDGATHPGTYNGPVASGS